MSRAHLAFILSLFLASASAAGEPVETRGGSQGLLEWTSTSGDQKAKAVHLYALRPDASTSQYFVVTPSGLRLILTNENRARRGTILARLKDDQTGWWIEMERDFQYTSHDLHGFFRTVLEREPSADAVIRHTVRTSSGFIFTAATPFIDPPRSIDLFVEQIETAGKLQELASEVPARLTGGISFLASVLSPASDLDRGKEVGTVVRLLTIALRTSKVRFEDPSKQTAWKGRVVWETVGLAVGEPEGVELLRGFKTAADGDLRDAPVVEKP